MPASKTPFTLGAARFTLYATGCVRLEYAHNGNFSPYPSVLTGIQSVKPIAADIQVKGKTLTLKTERFTLRYTDNGEVFSSANLTIAHRNHTGDAVHWAPGQADKGNLGSVRRSMDVWKWCGGPKTYPQEGLLSTDGGHFLPDEPRVYWNTDHQWIENRAKSVQFDGYFFAYGNDYKQALKDFITVFGPIPMVPRWTFGFWYSRWYAYKDQEFLALAKRYRREKIPIDVMIIDTDWRDGWGGYDWSKKYFPNPTKTLRELHNMGLHTSLNDHPGYDGYEPLPANDSHIPGIQRALGPLPHNGEWACDWSNPQAMSYWRDHVLGPFFKQGMDFWWVDGWIKPPASSLDSQLWANHQYYDLAETCTGKRGMILSRWGGIGGHRYPVQFSGDTHSNWETLKEQIVFTARSGNLGAVYWSHDIGGFHEKKIDEEIFIRWFQFGSLSPVFRTHSAFGIREPWHFSAQCKALFRKQTRMRYALAPYLYGLAREAHETGMPICRPLYLEYNDNDGGAINLQHQYTLGPDLLVIPADGPIDAKSGYQRKPAYFPDGQWRSLESDEVYRGLHNDWLNIPLDRIPTFVRDGAIIPAQPVGDALGTDVPETLHIDYYPHDTQSSTYRLYEDDGESRECLKGRFAETELSGERRENRIRFRVAAPKGTYRGMPKRRTFVIRCRVDAHEQVRSATVQIGRKAAVPVKTKRSHNVLAATLKSPWSFVEVFVKTPNHAVNLVLEMK